VGAALVTILSEFSLLFPFYYSVKRHVGTVPWTSIFVGPVTAVVTMGGTSYLLTWWGINLWIAVALGALIYAIALGITGTLRHEDMKIVGQSMPLGPLRRWFAPTTT